jgi:hypothetical protein
MNLKAFFIADKMRATTIYTMPSDSDVEEFSKTKTDPVFRANRAIRERISLDNTFLKQVGDRFIHFKGTRSKTAPISTSADVLIHDEKDRSDLKIVESYQSRITGEGSLRWTWNVSNPSQNRVGIDLDWDESDKKEWFVKCPRCRRNQTLIWEKNVDEMARIYVCADCGAPISARDIMLGHWEPTSRGRVSGYHISQMMATWLSPGDLIESREKRGVEYFRNFVLGEPWSPGEVSDFSRTILDSWTQEPLDSGRLFLGVDVGRRKHWVLGNASGIFRIGKTERREEIEEILRKYDPIAVMDSGPERTWAEEFRKKFLKLFICFYHKDTEQQRLVTWGGLGAAKTEKEFNKLGYVWIDRNRLIDDLVYNMQRGEVLFHLMREDLEEYIEHWQTMRRTEKVDAVGRKRYSWDSTSGVNHYASATWFYWVARSGFAGPAAEFLREPGAAEKKLIQVTAEGQKMRDLKEIMEEEKNQ